MSEEKKVQILLKKGDKKGYIERYGNTDEYQLKISGPDKQKHVLLRFENEEALQQFLNSSGLQEVCVNLSSLSVQGGGDKCPSTSIIVPAVLATTGAIGVFCTLPSDDREQFLKDITTNRTLKGAVEQCKGFAGSIAMTVLRFFHQLCDGVKTLIGTVAGGVANVVKAMVSSVGWTEAPQSDEEKLSEADATEHLPKTAADSKRWMYMVMGCSLKAFEVAAFGYVLYRLYKWWSRNDEEGKAVSDTKTIQGGETDDAALRRACDHESLTPFAQKIVSLAAWLKGFIEVLLIVLPLVFVVLAFIGAKYPSLHGNNIYNFAMGMCVTPLMGVFAVTDIKDRNARQRQIRGGNENEKEDADATERGEERYFGALAAQIKALRKKVETTYYYFLNMYMYYLKSEKQYISWFDSLDEQKKEHVTDMYSDIKTKARKYLIEIAKCMSSLSSEKRSEFMRKEYVRVGVEEDEYTISYVPIEPTKELEYFMNLFRDNRQAQSEEEMREIPIKIERSDGSLWVRTHTIARTATLQYTVYERQIMVSMYKNNEAVHFTLDTPLVDLYDQFKSDDGYLHLKCARLPIYKRIVHAMKKLVARIRSDNSLGGGGLTWMLSFMISGFFFFATMVEMIQNNKPLGQAFTDVRHSFAVLLRSGADAIDVDKYLPRQPSFVETTLEVNFLEDAVFLDDQIVEIDSSDTTGKLVETEAVPLASAPPLAADEN